MTVRTLIGSELVDVGVGRESMQYRLVHLCADFDDSKEWSATAPTASHWIGSRLSVEICTAREWIRIGKALQDLPVLDSAFESHRLSYSKIRVLTRFAKPDNEAELCDLAEKVPAGCLNTALAAWSMKNDKPSDIKDRQRRDRGLFCRTAPDGAFNSTLNYPTFEGAKFLAAIDARVMQMKPDASAGAWPSLAQQRSDALFDLVTNGGARVDTEVIIHVRGDGVTLDNGTPIAGTPTELVADAKFIRTMIHNAESKPINVSERHRFPTDRQKRFVDERDGGCCVDCGSYDFPEYDHNPDFETSQRTVVNELERRCSRCHKLRHERDKGKEA